MTTTREAMQQALTALTNMIASCKADNHNEICAAAHTLRAALFAKPNGMRSAEEWVETINDEAVLHDKAAGSYYLDRAKAALVIEHCQQDALSAQAEGQKKANSEVAGNDCIRTRSAQGLNDLKTSAVTAGETAHFTNPSASDEEQSITFIKRMDSISLHDDDGWNTWVAELAQAFAAIRADERLAIEKVKAGERD